MIDFYKAIKRVKHQRGSVFFSCTVKTNQNPKDNIVFMLTNKCMTILSEMHVTYVRSLEI